MVLPNNNKKGLFEDRTGRQGKLSRSVFGSMPMQGGKKSFGVTLNNFPAQPYKLCYFHKEVDGSRGKKKKHITEDKDTGGFSVWPSQRRTIIHTELEEQTGGPLVPRLEREKTKLLPIAHP